MKVFLLKSISYRILNNEIKNITEGITNITTFSLNEVMINDVISDASYYGLFAEKRCIIVKDTKFFGGKFAYEEESELLYNFLALSQDDTIMIFVCDDIKKTKDLTKKVINLGATIIDISSIDNDKMKELINDYCQDNNIKIDAKACDLLIKNSLNNIDIAIQEIDKLSLASDFINLEVVKNYGSKETDDETFNFSNAVIAKDFTKAFNLLDELLNNGVDGNALVGLLANSFTNMYMVKDALSHNLSDEEIAKTLGYSGTGRVYIMKKNSKIYTLEQIKEIILNLAELDIKLKTGFNPVYSLKEFLLNL